MAVKLAKNALPDGHTRDDFKAFGPVVTKNTEWGSARLCDLGCFKQEEVDSNKYYHISAVQSTKNGVWFAYYEWGRTKNGAPDKPNYQFFQCSSEQEAIKLCEEQFHEKNTKRGTWEKIGSTERFVSKPNKDAYVVRPTATRVVGLPCAKNIANEDAKGAKGTATPVAKTTKKSSGRKLDTPTKNLFRDLLGGAVKYANAMFSGKSGGKATLPIQAAIDNGRSILDDALAQIKIVGGNIDDQKKDRVLRQLTYNLYGEIPKAKPIGAAEESWLLTQDNIIAWRLDLDAFETALQANEINVEEEETDVMQGIPADVHHIPESDSLYKFIAPWWIGATRNRHGHVGTLKIHNLWAVERTGDRGIVRAAQEATIKEIPKTWNNERPLHQLTKDRPDLTAAERKLFWDSNTALMFHGTRSVNVPGIIRENLRFPNQLTGVIITGAMFGPGSYFADDFKKSAGYCSNPNPSRHSYYGGGGEVQGRHAFMFCFDVICGHPHVAPDAYGFTQPPAGHHCVYGKAGHTASWGRHGGLMNNEWIVYKRGRIEMRYLAEISF